jgi:ribosomal protein S18 acetylase RimI-like enzyme
VAADELSRCGSDVLRVRSWRSRTDVAQLTPLSMPGGLTFAHVGDVMNRLRLRGVHSLVTSAVGPADAAAFLRADFSVREELQLLNHDLADVVDAPALVAGDIMRRPSKGELPALLKVDANAFRGFWRFDAPGLQDAIRATPHTRVRAIEAASDHLHREIVAYAVTGRAGRHGFLQRLAVSPEHSGRGLGAYLTLDGLRWLQRRRCIQGYVNTQIDNHRALELYERLGYTAEPHGLLVLQRGPTDGPLGIEA